MRRIVVGMVAVGLLTVAAPQALASSEGYGCRAERRTVGGPTGDATVATWLCAVGDPTGKPVIATVPGTTYTHTYWDWDQEPDRYSFARAMADAGYAVLLHDRLGTGASDLPPAHLVTLDLHASVLHELVGQLRAAGHPWVATAGHSQGSLIVMAEAARHHDVDAIVITGMLHAPLNPLGAVVVAGSFAHPAQLDVRFGDVPLGYTTTLPGWREPAFYGPTADPAVIAHDEATKTVTAPIELATALPALLESPLVDVPVLSAIGQHDAAFCPPVVGCGSPLLPDPIDVEPAAWRASPRLETYVLPGSGHNLNLHVNAGDWFAAALGFLGAASTHS